METYDYAKYGVCAKNPLPEVSQTTWNDYIDNHSQKTILDVRPANQYDILHLKNTLNIPFERLTKLTKQEILEALHKEDSEDFIPVSCARGVMSRHATKYLNSLGVSAVSIEGGISAYRVAFDPSLP